MRSYSTPLPSRDFIVSQQVQTLLNAANTFMAFIANSRFQEVHEPDKGPLDGGIKASTEVTLMNICDRLDTILRDNSRWGMEQLNRLEVQLSELYTSHQLALNEQRKAMVMTSAPQSRLSPQLLKMPDGGWVAFIGNPQTNNSVIGVGACVQDALDNFDKLIEGKPVEVIANIKTNEQAPKTTGLDGSGNRPASKTSSPEQQPGNRANPRAKSKVNRTKTRKASRSRQDSKNPVPAKSHS